jgi:aspartate carbamoyltransferase catalytic subunit
MRSFLGRDILSLKDWERAEFYRLFQVAQELEPIARKRRNSDLLAGKTLVTAFYQPSTRTRLSHEAAMHRLGGAVCGFSDAKMTRAGDFYQESIKDTVHMLEYYGDVIAMRHFQQGAPAEAAKHCSVPVINCGDGWGEHPTQILSDLYTLHRSVGRIDGLTILAVGDHRMRTMHTLCYAASQFDMKLYLVAPPDMAPKKEFLAELDEMNVQYKLAESTESCIHDCDVIYMEPVVQADYSKSRVEAGDVQKGITPPQYKITREMMLKKAKKDAIILHSLPRMDELPLDCDHLRHARYWEEAFYGVAMKMGMLALILGAAE